MPGFPPRSWGRPWVELVALEPTAAQVTWVGLPIGPVPVRLIDDRGGERTRHHDSDGGPSGVVLDGLVPGRRYRLEVAGRVMDLRTPPTPPGDPIFRLATISDVHLGATSTGVTHRMRERGPVAVPHPMRCGRAAIGELSDWGARMLVVKGDLVEHGHADQWAEADVLLRGAGMPVAVTPGNHEVKPSRSMDHPETLVDGEVEIVGGVSHHDLPGLRLILVNTSIDGRGVGRVRHLTDEVADLAASAETGVLVAMHHYAQRFHLPWFWPPGIPGGESRAFLRAISRANRRTLVTSGHTHRNRIRRHGPVVVTEVGSTKDFPGVWAGYVVHEGGITQTVRRTLAPEAMRWTEYTRRAVGGIWGRWSMGSLSDRCISHAWPVRG